MSLPVEKDSLIKVQSYKKGSWRSSISWMARQVLSSLGGPLILNHSLRSALEESLKIFEVEEQYVANHQGSDHKFSRGKYMKLRRVVLATGNFSNQSRRFVKRCGSYRHRESECRVTWGELQAQEIPEGEINGDRHEDGDPQKNRAEE